MSEPIVIPFCGRVPTKKNSYTPRRSGKGKGFFKDTKLQSELDALAWQVPDQYRDIHLSHPDVVFEYVLPPNSKNSRRWSADSDGLTTSLIDILVQLGVFEDDCFAKFNGTKTILPAKVAEDGIERAIVTIYPR